MKFIRYGSNGDAFLIEPETEQERTQLEEAIGWRDKGTLGQIITQLKGYMKL